MEREESGVHKKAKDKHIVGSLSLKKLNALGIFGGLWRLPRGAGHQHRPSGVDPEVKGSP